MLPRCASIQIKWRAYLTCMLLADVLVMCFLVGVDSFSSMERGLKEPATFLSVHILFEATILEIFPTIFMVVNMYAPAVLYMSAFAHSELNASARLALFKTFGVYVYGVMESNLACVVCVCIIRQLVVWVLYALGIKEDACKLLRLVAGGGEEVVVAAAPRKSSRKRS
jgi:hypothetical protein